MAEKILDAILSEYLEASAGDASDGTEIARFRRFLLAHGGLRRLEAPGRPAMILEAAASLRCFHFSQYLDWYLPEKEGQSKIEVEKARDRLDRFNSWLLERGAIGREEFEENRESIRGGDEGPPAFQEIAAGEEGDLRPPSVAEERDFYVPGEYLSVLSGEFVITKVQEGILYGRRDGDPGEVGPILVDRAVSGGSRVGDRVHMSLGKAGGHWNLLTLGRRKE